MKKILQKAVILCLLVAIFCATAVYAAPSSNFITTDPTGYDSADDVVYVTYTQSGKTVIANWGARGETCVFLSDYAQDYYAAEYTFEILSGLSGGTSTSNAPSSRLYTELQELMESTHSFYTYYSGSKNVRDFYRYTDCVSSDITQVALLYRGGLQTSEWNSGSIWNQEHVWPKSKLDTDEQIGDIMHLRPANPSENSSRGNKAYGKGSGCYDPGVSVRGDCARMVLYMYVRYGVTDTMWGSSGVIENLDTLLAWMAEDPVDTWEMGRNDSVQSVTGVRNVFVDYPELAWLLFGQEVPEDLVTPSGNTTDTPPAVCTHENTQVRNASNATCVSEGYTGDTYCADCGELVAQGEIIPANGQHNFGPWKPSSDGQTQTRQCRNCGHTEVEEVSSTPCEHNNTELRDVVDATCGAAGYTGDTYCADCGELIASGETTPATGEHSLDEHGYCVNCDYFEAPEKCPHERVELRDQTDATCGTDGYTGDTYCADCGELIAPGETIPATGEHENVEHRNQGDATCSKEGHTGDVYCADCGVFIAGGSVIPATGHTFGQWQTSADGTLRFHTCTKCGYAASEDITPVPTPEPGPEPEKDPMWLYIAAAAAGLILIGFLAMIIGRKKKR